VPALVRALAQSAKLASVTLILNQAMQDERRWRRTPIRPQRCGRRCGPQRPASL